MEEVFAYIGDHEGMSERMPMKLGSEAVLANPDIATFGCESTSKSFCTSRLTRGRRLGQFAMLPSLGPRVKQRRGKNFDMLTSYEVALSN